ncbi:histidine kinase N-terminal 7TM domain-containing protein [Clostridium sp. E02]|uniref:histidine kinase N-terminal 7TM domain-containing diguanylate cyclase n=1 Tax=Clostridium sp. E02 TaxID=2487134 RepID=UPI000F52FDA7|nr:histidine kinase N-terminal 7TM domain-containing protein [Clostridium sp. E02]
MNNVMLSVLLIISSTLIGNFVIYGLASRRTPGIYYFCLLMAAMIFHSVGYAFELLSVTADTMYIWIRIEYIGASFYPILIMMFTREYAEEKRFANRYVVTLVLMVNIITLVLVYTNNYHFLYYASVGVDYSPGFPILALQKGVWYLVQVLFLCFSILYSMVVLIIKLKRTSGNYKNKVLFMLIGVTVPVVTMFLYLLGLGPVYLDMTPFSYFIMSICLTIGLLRYDMLVLAPITYEMIFQSINEAVLVIDSNEILVGFNNVSKEFFPSLSKMKIGQSFGLVEELKGHNLDATNSIHDINGRKFNFKTFTMKTHRARIYVANDITESENAKKQLEILATVDSLTGLYNRRYFMEQVKQIGFDGVFVILDLDHFKRINDTFGHFKGDQVLSNFGKLLRQTFPDHITCRYGGEEFAVFLAHTGLGEAYRRTDSLRDKNNNETQACKVTFSAGIAEYNIGSGTVSEALIRADQKLYEAKENGRDRICL